jgi:hypothetical protein
MTLVLSVTDRVSDADVAQINAGLAASEPDLGPYSPAPLAVLLPVSVIHPDNVASIRVAQKLGARLERRMILRREEVVIYRHRYTDR